MAASPAVAQRLLCYDAPNQDMIQRLRQQDMALRQARFWEFAISRASAWARTWEWEYSPHVRSRDIDNATTPCTPVSICRSPAPTRHAHTCLSILSQVIELGEDLLSVVMQGTDSTILSVAATCRCLRGLLLPRLVENKARAVRDLYIAGCLA